MNNLKTERKYSLLAGICFVVFVWSSILFRVINMMKSEYFTLDDIKWWITWNVVVEWIVIAGFAILLLIGKKHIGFLIVTGVVILLYLYYMVNYPTIGNVACFLAYILLCITFALNIIPPMQKLANATKVLAYLPAAVLFMGFLIYWIQEEAFSDLEEWWMWMLLIIMEVAALLFAGLWLKETMVVTQPRVQQNAHATSNTLSMTPKPPLTARRNDNAVSESEILRIHKGLLDAGTITQEEFEAKKKQILGGSYE